MSSIATRNGGFYSFSGWAGMGDKHRFWHKVFFEVIIIYFIAFFEINEKKSSADSLQILGLSSYKCFDLF